MDDVKEFLKIMYLLSEKKWDISGKTGIFWWEKGTLAEQRQTAR